MSYTCPSCHRVSHNPHDEIERYCGKCHRYEDDGKNARLAELVAEANRSGNRPLTLSEAKALESLQAWARKGDREPPEGGHGGEGV